MGIISTVKRWFSNKTDTTSLPKPGKEQGMNKCKICGAEFMLKKENRYLCKEVVSIPDTFNGKKSIIHEAFDCPVCGCQNVVNERYIDIVSIGLTQCNILDMCE